MTESVIIDDDFDDTDFAELVDTILKQNGVTEYAKFARSQDLLDEIEKCFDECPHLFVIDYRLDGEHTGMEIMQKVRKKFPWCYVVIVSGQVDKSVLIDFLNEDANHYIEKTHDGSYLIKIAEIMKKGIKIAKAQHEVYQEALAGAKKLNLKVG